MSTLALPVIRHGRALALAIVLMAVVCVMVLMWATTGSSGSPSTGVSDPREAVTDAGVNPWEANDPALVTR